MLKKWIAIVDYGACDINSCGGKCVDACKTNVLKIKKHKIKIIGECFREICRDCIDACDHNALAIKDCSLE